MRPFFGLQVFPSDVTQALENYLDKSYASSGADLNLSRVLQKYDAIPSLTLEEVGEGRIFSLRNGKIYKKGPLNRKRYRCVRVDNNKTYLVSPLVKVELVESL